MNWVLARPRARPNNPQAIAPASGRATISHSPWAAAEGSAGEVVSSCPRNRRRKTWGRPWKMLMGRDPLVLHRRDFADVQGSSAAKDRDDDREANRRFRGRHRDHEKGGKVARHVAPLPGEGEEGQVGDRKSTRLN